MITDATLRELLLSQHYVSEEDIAYAEKNQRAGMSLADALFSADLITRDILGQAIAEFYSVRYADPDTHTPILSVDVIEKLTVEKALALRAIVVQLTADAVAVATDDPSRDALMGEIATLFPGKAVTVMFMLADDLDGFLTLLRQPLAQRVAGLLKGDTHVARRIVEEIIDEAVIRNASDIHLEPMHDGVMVRFRVDGVLIPQGVLPHSSYSAILNRIKVQSLLRLDEHRAAQDGALRHMRGDDAIDLRVSIVPTIDGEKIALRVLSSHVRALSLESIGLGDGARKTIAHAASQPFGMIVAAGPTGSGKTTTLYALLKTFNRVDSNITTIEDPVEYKMPQINQIQVNAAAGLTFARGLRAVVRQDPDIILVGEIRDDETADIAVNAALTGHRVLSTFHANDAPSVIPRLIEMGIEPFLLASTLECIVAQRLVRTICQSCRVGETVSVADVPWVRFVREHEHDETVTLYRGKGCPLCAHTGYRGRTALFEVLPMTSALRDVIGTSPSAQEIRRTAHIPSLFEDGIAKVRLGVTTLDEVLRVAPAPSAE